jgi:HK97 family phage major capsid protein
VDAKRLELELAGADVDRERRVIEGTMLPYNELGVADVDGEPRAIRFRAGSIRPARDRTPLTLGHDEEQPIGVLLELTDDGARARARFRVDATPAGDAALVQAASGSRSGLSAGALALEYRENAGELEVTAAELYHVGLVAVPAMPSAQVSRVAAASAENNPKGAPMSEQSNEELAASIGESTTDEELEQLLTHEDESIRTKAADEIARRKAAAEAGDNEEQEQLPTDAARARELPVIHAGRPRDRVCSGSELVIHMVRAAGGDRQSARVVEAALSPIASAGVPGLMPPSYVGDILGTTPQPRPLADRVAVRRPLPSVGMMFSKPKWTTKPAGGWVAENAATPSNAPAIGKQDVNVLEWAYGVSMSYAVATRSSPDAIETIFREAVKDYYSDAEQKIADLLMANDVPGAVGDKTGDAIAAYYVATKTPPNLLVLSPDVYATLIDSVTTVPTYWDASGAGVSANLTGSIAGLEIVVSPHLPAATELITARGVVELREDTPVRLTVNVIGALAVELGVTTFATFDLEGVAGSIASITPPAGAMEAGSTRKK